MLSCVLRLLHESEFQSGVHTEWGPTPESNALPFIPLLPDSVSDNHGIDGHISLLIIPNVSKIFVQYLKYELLNAPHYHATLFPIQHSPLLPSFFPKRRFHFHISAESAGSLRVLMQQAEGSEAILWSRSHNTVSYWTPEHLPLGLHQQSYKVYARVPTQQLNSCILMLTKETLNSLFGYFPHPLLHKKNKKLNMGWQFPSQVVTVGIKTHVLE